jgi:Zn-dependent protease with chaperone function
MGLILRSSAVLGMLYALIFAFVAFAVIVVAMTTGTLEAAMTASYFLLPAIIALIFVFVQFLISPFLMDFIMRFVYKMSWIDKNLLPPEMAQAITEEETKHGFKIGKIGIIHDGTPNAFTYGHFRNNARLVFTQGTIDLLDPDERVAVTKHEIGHVVHYDFVFMTLAQAVPLLFFLTYLSSRIALQTMSRTRKSTNNKAEGAMMGGLVGIVILSYLMYIISGYIVLFLSRLREYYADHYSAHATNNPGALSSALVKIAYGIVAEDAKKEEMLQNENLDSKERRRIERQKGIFHGMRAMGISDHNTSKGLVMTVYAQNEEVNDINVAKAASWDIYSPWAKFLELSSTHPLTGKRLGQLNKTALELNVEPRYPQVGKIKPPESLWDEFFQDVFVQYWLVGILVIGSIASAIIFELIGLGWMFGLGLMFIVSGGLWAWRIKIKYPPLDNVISDDVTKNTVLEVMSSIEKTDVRFYRASPVRGKPILIEGRVMGRGTPGYHFGDDFVVRDQTGFIRIEYSSIIPFYRYWFGWKHVRDMMDQDVRVVGWYHRSMAPWIQLHEVRRGDGKIHKNHWQKVNKIFMYFLIVLGGILLILSI